jgi:hypothetical protein
VERSGFEKYLWLGIFAFAVLSGLTQAVSHWTGLPVYLVGAITALVVGVAVFLVRLRR